MSPGGGGGGGEGYRGIQVRSTGRTHEQEWGERAGAGWGPAVEVVPVGRVAHHLHRQRVKLIHGGKEKVWGIKIIQ